MSIEILVAGSLHFDILVAGPRLPQIGETLAGTGWMTKCGGKGGNQAVEAARHGAAAAMVGCIGDDEFGGRLEAHLAAAGVDTRFIRRGESGSGMSVALSDAGGDYAAVIVTGSNALVQVADIEAAAQELAPGGLLVLQNEIPEAANLAAARAARSRGARVMINAAPVREMTAALLELVDILIVNALEAQMLGGGTVADLPDAARAAEALTRLVPSVIVTAGGHGLALSAPGISATIGAHAVGLISTHGAGDAFAGALAARLVKGETLEKAAIYANAAAAVLVSTPEAQRHALTSAATVRLLQSFAPGRTAP